METKRKILIVDDDEDFLDLYEKKLGENGFQVCRATNSNECEKLIKQEKPELIIMDIALGVEDGTDLYNGLIERGLDRGVPVIFLSALADDMDVSKAQEGRRYALLSKRIKFPELVNQLKCLMRESQSPSS